MKIEFENNLEGYQKALKLRQILIYCTETHSDKDALVFIESLINQINEFVASPEFEQYQKSHPAEAYEAQSVHKSIASEGLLSSLWQSLVGPSRRELILSKQRIELIERAEHAESMAFEALAETAEVGKERDEVLKKIKNLEEEIALLKTTD